MSFGRLRFEAQLVAIETLIKESKFQENRFFWLYENNLRSSFFMLEGLARLYAQAHNKKLFTKIKDKAKDIEDALGWLDFYYHYYQVFSKNRKLSAEVKAYFIANFLTEAHQLFVSDDETQVSAV